MPQDSLLVTLVQLIDLIPAPPNPAQRKRGRTKTYPDQLFLKALLIMIVRQVHTPSDLLATLCVAQATQEMQMLRQELSLAFSAVFVYQLAILYCFLQNSDLRVGFKALLKAA